MMKKFLDKSRRRNEWIISKGGKPIKEHSDPDMEDCKRIRG